MVDVQEIVADDPAPSPSPTEASASPPIAAASPVESAAASPVTAVRGPVRRGSITEAFMELHWKGCWLVT